MTDPDPTAVAATPISVAQLNGREATPFALAPEAETRAAVAAALELVELPELAFSGKIVPAGARDWQLDGRLVAVAVQACVVSLAPVQSAIDTPVTRRFLDRLPEEAATGEVEMPEDETIEPLGPVIDPGRVMVEALALALPDYPRAPGADPGEAVFAAPGVEPLRDADMKPLAGLADLKNRMDGDG